MENMDLVSIGLSAVLSAILFIILEFTIILPLFRKIVTKSVNDMVQSSLLPSISAYIDSKIDDLVKVLTKSLYSKFTGFIGGRKRGVNSVLERLAAGEDLAEIEDDYQPSTIDKVYDIVAAVSPYLPDPTTLKGVLRNGKEKEILDKDEDSLQIGAAQAFKPQEIV